MTDKMPGVENSGLENNGLEFDGHRNLTDRKMKDSNLE